MVIIGVEEMGGGVNIEADCRGCSDKEQKVADDMLRAYMATRGCPQGRDPAAARLAACAPDMCRLLENIAGTCECRMNDPREPRDIIWVHILDRIDELLRRVRGEPPDSAAFARLKARFYSVGGEKG